MQKIKGALANTLSSLFYYAESTRLPEFSGRPFESDYFSPRLVLLYPPTAITQPKEIIFFNEY